MAKTTSKSTKAKTKTTTKKSDDTKTAKAVVAEKTVDAKVTKPTIDKKVSNKVKRAKKALTTGSLRKLHAVSVVVFAALAVAAGALMQTAPVTLSSGYLTRNELASGSETVFVAAQRVVYDVDLRYVLIGLLAVSAVFSLLRLRWMWAKEEAGIARRIMPWRWVDAAVTGMLAVEITALAAGLSDMVAVKALGLLTVATMLFAWLAERENAGSARAVRASFYASVFFGVITTLLLAAPVVDTLVYADVRATWYVYALWYIVALSFFFGGLNQWKSYKHGAVWNYLYIERNYLLLNLVAKAALAGILIAGLMK